MQFILATHQRFNAAQSKLLTEVNRVVFHEEGLVGFLDVTPEWIRQRDAIELRFTVIRDQLAFVHGLINENYNEFGHCVEMIAKQLDTVEVDLAAFKSSLDELMEQRARIRTPNERSSPRNL